MYDYLGEGLRDTLYGTCSRPVYAWMLDSCQSSGSRKSDRRIDVVHSPFILWSALSLPLPTSTKLNRGWLRLKERANACRSCGVFMIPTEDNFRPRPSKFAYICTIIDHCPAVSYCLSICARISWWSLCAASDPPSRLALRSISWNYGGTKVSFVTECSMLPICLLWHHHHLWVLERTDYHPKRH